MISAATRRLVGAAFTCEPIAAPSRRGAPPEIELFRVVAASEPGVRGDADADADAAPCVGRDAEIRWLLDRWEQASGGAGQIVIVAGGAGIGKSRLVRALRAALARERSRWIECRCSPYFENTALAPFVDLLRRMARITEADDEAQRLSKLEQALGAHALPKETLTLFAPLLSAASPARAAPLNLSPQRQKQKTQEAFLALLQEIAAGEPLCFVMEDLHWADPSTIELLGLLVQQAPGMGLLAVFTCRHGFAPAWGGREHVSQITLSKLPRNRVEAIIDRVAGGKALPRDLVASIVAKTDGVPLFVEELTKMVLESSLLRDAGSRWELAGPLPSLAIPSTLRDSLTARLDKLGHARATAQLAATIGREFTYEVLEAVSPLDGAALEADLARLVEGELIHQQGFPPRATYTFKHILVQEAAYASMLKVQRQTMHERIAETLLARFPERVEAQPEVLAHHYEGAGVPARAAAFLLRAGQRATARSANAEAVGHLNKALQLVDALPEAPERDYLEISLRAALGAPLMVTRGYGAPELEATYARALALSEKSALVALPELMPVLWGLWIFYLVRSKHNTSLSLAVQLLKIANRTGDAGDLLCAHIACGNTMILVGRPQEAREHLEKALSHHDAAAHGAFAFIYGQDAATHALAMLAWALALLGHPEDAFRRADEAVAAAQAVSHPNSLGMALGVSSLVCHLLEDAPRALRRSAELIDVCNEQGIVHWIGMGHLVHGWARKELGEPASGLDEMEEGRRRWREIGSRSADSQWDATLIQAYVEAGRREDALALLAQARVYVDESGERLYVPELDRLEGEIQLMCDGEHAAAEASFRRAIEGAARAGEKLLELRAAVRLGALYRDLGRSEEALRLVGDVLATFPEATDARDVRRARELIAG